MQQDMNEGGHAVAQIRESKRQIRSTRGGVADKEGGDIHSKGP